jgi:integrase/recombinase XerD
MPATYFLQLRSLRNGGNLITYLGGTTLKTEQAIRDFIASRHAANLSPETISWYEDRLLPFARFQPILPRRPESIEFFLASLQDSDETKYDVYRALKTFFKFICKRRRLPNPMDDVQPPHRRKIVMPTLEADELVRLLGDAETLLEKAIITTLIDSGLRAGELCSLLKQNIKQQTLIVQGKIGWRELPISQETRILLLQLAGSSPNEFVFYDYKKGHLDRHQVYAIVRSLLNKAGITGLKVGPHRLRHAFGKNYLVCGGDLRSLQEIMGHADIETTQKYASLNLNDVINKHRQFSPLRYVQFKAHESQTNNDAVLIEAESILLKKKKDD